MPDGIDFTLSTASTPCPLPTCPRDMPMGAWYDSLSPDEQQLLDFEQSRCGCFDCLASDLESAIYVLQATEKLKGEGRDAVLYSVEEQLRRLARNGLTEVRRHDPVFAKDARARIMAIVSIIFGVEEVAPNQGVRRAGFALAIGLLQALAAEADARS